MPIPYFVNIARGQNSNNGNALSLFPKLVHGFMNRKTDYVWRYIGKQIEGNKVLDVGMGAGAISFFMAKKGFTVTSVDIENLSIYDNLSPLVYDGHKLPFKEKEFDTAVIIHVLHHCEDGLEVLREAKRVANRVVFIEDTFRNKLEWVFLQFNDALMNFEFKFHKFRTSNEWSAIIKKNGWKMVYKYSWFEVCVSSFYSRYCMFVVE